MKSARLIWISILFLNFLTACGELPIRRESEACPTIAECRESRLMGR